MLSIRSEAIDKLIELGIIDQHDEGPLLSPYGEKCFVVMESGDGSVPEFYDYPPADT
jgi:hypothetical protein